MTHLSLFTGIGGLDLAAERAGFTTVGQCEWADYPTKVLEKHWPDVPRWRDIRTLTGESFYERTGLRTVDIISGGFPCQPFSVAGKQRGKDDDRYLWPEMLRVIREIQPTWVVGENVAGIVNMALDTVLADLEDCGYSCQAFIIPACGVDAPHRRNRVCIVGRKRGEGNLLHSNAQSEQHTDIGEGKKALQKQSGINGLCEDVADGNNSGYIHRQPKINSAETGEYAQCKSIGCGKNVADGNGKGLEGRTEAGNISQGGEKRNELLTGCDRSWAVEPDVGRVANGIRNRVDRLKCLGNAVVPQQFYPIFQAIAEIERGEAS